MYNKQIVSKSNDIKIELAPHWKCLASIARIIKYFLLSIILGVCYDDYTKKYSVALHIFLMLQHLVSVASS
jgi:hypothetical protein